MPVLATTAEETRLPEVAASSLPELASFPAASPGYEDTRALDGPRASEYCLAAVPARLDWPGFLDHRHVSALIMISGRWRSSRQIRIYDGFGC